MVEYHYWVLYSTTGYYTQLLGIILNYIAHLLKRRLRSSLLRSSFLLCACGVIVDSCALLPTQVRYQIAETTQCFLQCSQITTMGGGGGGGGHARTDASALEQVPLVSTEQAFWMLA